MAVADAVVDRVDQENETKMKKIKRLVDVNACAGEVDVKVQRVNEARQSRWF